MAAKSILPVYHGVVAASMTGTITSPITDVRQTDNIVYFLTWTGTPAGTFAVNTSSDYMPAPNPGAAPQNAGTWLPLSLSATISAAGSADQARIELSQLPDPYVQLVYTPSSSTGTLDVWVSGKGT